MATAHVTRARGARSGRTRPTPKPPSAATVAATSKDLPHGNRAAPALGFGRRASHRAQAKASTHYKLNTELQGMALRLAVLHSTCVTVELALKSQNAEQDADIARCLMRNVTEPLYDEAKLLQEIARGLERQPVSSPPVRP